MVTGYTDGVFNIRIMARPEKGKANESLIKYLSDLLGIAKSRISISKGNTSRNKVVVIQDLSNKNAVSRLTKSINSRDST